MTGTDQTMSRDKVQLTVIDQYVALWYSVFFLYFVCRYFFSCTSVLIDSEEEYFDVEDGSKPIESALIKGDGKKDEPEAVKEELTDLQLKFEIKEASALIFL